MSPRFSSISDTELAHRCASIEARAQRELYDRHIDIMYNVVYRYLFQKEDTEDTLQIAFSKVFSSIKKYNPKQGSLASWIRKICIHAALDQLRKRKTRWKHQDTYSQQERYVEINLAEKSTEQIMFFLSQLPESQRSIFILKEIEGYSYSEIATLLDISPDSCRVYLSRAKRHLQKMYKSSLNLHKTSPNERA